MPYIGAGLTRFNTADELTVTGDAQIDTTTLVVDSTNNRVGVGKASPTTALDVSGTVTATAYAGDGSSLTGINTDLVGDTTPQLGGVLDTNGNNIEFGDSTGAEVERLKFGADDDMEMYHDGSNGYVVNNAGNLILDDRGGGGVTIKYNTETMANFAPDGAATLYYDNASKIATTSTGVAVTDTVQFGSDAQTYIKSAGASGVDLLASGDTNIRFETGTNERMRINSSGELLIGKTASDNTTEGFRFRTTGEATFVKNSSSGAPIYVNRQGNNGTAINFGRANSQVGTITVNTSGTTYNTTSDRRLKTDVQPIADGTDKLMQMQPVTHKWIADPDADAVHGFIAQDMQQVCPEAVSGEDGGEEMMSMDYGRITPVLVAALQDAHRKIEQLEQRIVEMENV